MGILIFGNCGYTQRVRENDWTKLLGGRATACTARNRRAWQDLEVVGAAQARQPEAGVFWLWTEADRSLRYLSARRARSALVPQLNELMADAHRRRFDAVVVWKIDRFGRSLKHLVNALADLCAYGVAFISFRDNLDLSTPSGRLMFQIIGAMAEFERSLIQERVKEVCETHGRRGRSSEGPALRWMLYVWPRCAAADFNGRRYAER